MLKGGTIMDVTVRRNAYGRQLGSFSVTGDAGDITGFPLKFIRAPYIEGPGDSEVLTVCKDRVVAAGYGDRLVTAFHPELTGVHRYFLDMVGGRRLVAGVVGPCTATRSTS